MTYMFVFLLVVVGANMMGTTDKTIGLMQPLQFSGGLILIGFAVYLWKKGCDE